MKNIVMVGAGGTASHLIHPLIIYLTTQYEEVALHVWDRDTVEEKNLLRQLFYPWEVGAPKATAFSERFTGLIVPHLAYIGEDNVEDAIRDNDIVLICADNMAVRRVINTYAKELDNITVINGGNEEHTGSVQLFIREEGINRTPSLDFFSPEFDPANDEVDRSTMSCAEIAELPGGEQTIMANNSTAALMLAALWRSDNTDWVTFDSENPQWTKSTFDHARGTTQQSDVRVIGGYE